MGNGLRKKVVIYRRVRIPNISSRFTKWLRIECIVRSVPRTFQIIQLIQSNQAVLRGFRIQMVHNLFRDLLTVL